MSINFHNKYNFISDLKIPEDVPKYLKKAVMIFNEIISDLRALSVEYENKINGLYALFVSLERVIMHHSEKMKSRINSPQIAEQFKTRLQICKNMKQVLNKIKNYDDLLTVPQKNLLHKSCNTDPLKPHSDNLNELTNPYFEMPITKPALIPDLLTKYNSSSKVNKERSTDTEMSSSSATTKPTVELTQLEDIVKSSKGYSTSTISTKVKRLHPWCKQTRTREEVKDRSTEKISQVKHPATKLSKLILISSNLAKKGHSEDSEEDILKESSKPELREDIEMGTKQRRQGNVKFKKNETVTEQQEVNRNRNQQKTNTKYGIQNNRNSVIVKKEVLSTAQEEELYPWQKEAAKNRQKESPLSDQMQKITEGACRLLPPVMKSKLFQNIAFPEKINQKIYDKIEQEGKTYACIDCTSNPSFSTKRRSTIMRHIITELGYYALRCSFCDEKSNDPRTLINHYAATHGIPSNWLHSN